jgi:uracil-DNA glycosylase family 4
MINDLEIFLARFRNQVEPLWSEETALKEDEGIYGPFISKGQCVVTSLLLQQALSQNFPDVRTSLKIGRVTDNRQRILIPNHGWLTANVDGGQYIIDATIDQAKSIEIPYLLIRMSDLSEVVYEPTKTLDLKTASKRKSLWKRYTALENRYNQNGYEEHYCTVVEQFPRSKFLQEGTGKGKRVLIVGEAPAPNGWRISGQAFYTPGGKLLPTGRNLNELLAAYDLSVKTVGFTELVKCFPGKKRGRLKNCGQKTWPIFEDQLRYGNYELLILLGVKTLEIFNQLTGYSLPIGEMKHVDINGGEFAVFPIYHPSPIAPYNHTRNIGLFQNTDNDIKQILEGNQPIQTLN